MTSFDVAIIGGGPGGYVAAIRAAQLGLNAAIFERERVGGLCLNWGCIPSKALLKNADAVNLVRDAARWGIAVDNPRFDYGAAIDRSRQVSEKIVSSLEGLIREQGITIIPGEAKLGGRREVVSGGTSYEARNVIVATGVASRALPGVAVDGRVVVTSREALARRELPGRAVIIGAGPVGVEFAHLWASYGAQVTVVELLETLLPLEDADAGRLLKRSFEARGITCLPGTKVQGVSVDGEHATVQLLQGDNATTLTAEVVLVAVGFVPHTDGLGLEAAGVATERGFITVDDHMETNAAGIYAVGDVTGKLMLAHVAFAQGAIAAEHIAGRSVPLLDYVQMPRATFCQPQVGSIGYTEAQAKAAGYAVKTGRFPLTALGKAVAIGETEGFVKVVADSATGQVLGIHMVGHDINELLGEATIAALLEATTIELGFAVHAHPTLAEAVKEAALAVDGEAIHIARRRAGTPGRQQGVTAH